MKIMIIIFLVAVLVTTSCSSSKTAATSSPQSTPQQKQMASPTPSFELTRDLVLRLVQHRLTKPVEASMPSQAVSDVGTENRFGVYDSMQAEKVLSCDEPFMYNTRKDCKPGPKAKGLRLDGPLLVLTLGNKVPSVDAVSRVDQTSGLAQVTLQFQPGPGFQIFEKWRGAFSRYNLDSEQHTVRLRLYDDGWRIEAIQ